MTSASIMGKIITIIIGCSLGIYGRIVSLDDNTVTLVLKKGELVVSKNKIDCLVVRCHEQDKRHLCYGG